MSSNDIPNSQKAVQTLRSIPSNAALHRALYSFHDEEGAPGIGSIEPSHTHGPAHHHSTSPAFTALKISPEMDVCLTREIDQLVVATHRRTEAPQTSANAARVPEHPCRRAFSTTGKDSLSIARRCHLSWMPLFSRRSANALIALLHLFNLFVTTTTPTIQGILHVKPRQRANISRLDVMET